jgi:hypothetical protein
MIGPKLIQRLLRASTGHTRDYDLWDNLLNDEIRGTAHRDEHLPHQGHCGHGRFRGDALRTPSLSRSP